MIMSCIIPAGHTTEQYMRPKSNVAITMPARISTLADSNAGMNWMRAIQPKYLCASPVKSVKSVVSANMETMARATLVFFSIMIWREEVRVF